MLSDNPHRSHVTISGQADAFAKDTKDGNYIIVSCSSFAVDELCEAIDFCMTEGYFVQGGISSTYTTGGTTLRQAMVKLELGDDI